MEVKYHRYNSRINYPRALLSLAVLVLFVKFLLTFFFYAPIIGVEDGSESRDEPTEFAFRENRTVFFMETNPATRPTRSLLCALESAANVYEDYDVSGGMLNSASSVRLLGIKGIKPFMA